MTILRWDKWQGSLDGRPTMYVICLLKWKGFRLDLHKFVRPDDKGCLHTHPAKAFRIILWGGYTEEILVKESTCYHAIAKKMITFGYLYVDKTLGWFSCGFVAPELCHRIKSLSRTPTYTLWFRWPVTHKIELKGGGWSKQENLYQSPNTVLSFSDHLKLCVEKVKEWPSWKQKVIRKWSQDAL